ncbi:MAG: membrane protein [Cyanobium sp. CACIAM 14]|nr:MAG: membrane protein [Cyanobium sp. CACIAM 14]
MVESKRFHTFTEFYTFYLEEHKNRISRRLHVLGTTIGVILFLAAVVRGDAWLILIALIQGYASSWAGHFFFEHNKPATFQYPLLSFMGDWRLWWDTLTGKQPF